MQTAARSLIALALLAGMAPWSGAQAAASPALLPFDMPSPATLQSSPRKVLAHWFLWPLSLDDRDPRAPAPPEAYARLQNSDAVRWDSRLRFRPLARPARGGDDWETADFAAEIRLAQAVGVDGFLFNYTATGRSGEEGLRKLVLLLRAAERLDGGFTIAPNLDLVGCGQSPNGFCTGTRLYTPEFAATSLLDALEAAGLRHSSHLMRHQGRLVVGSFAAELGPAEWWEELRRVFARHGEDIFVVCVFNSPSNRSRMRPFERACDTWSDWGNVNLDRNDRPYDRLWPNATKPIMGPIRSQDLRWRENWSVGAESRGSRLLRRDWEAAIRHGVDWVQLVTWNDHGEHSSHMPTTATQFGFADLNAYYATWYKTGRRPEIRRDALYFFHRIHRGGPWIRQHAGTSSWENEIEVVAFLTAPAEVRIETAAGTTTHALEAGMHSVRAPLPSHGNPRFAIRRDGRTVVDVTSPFTIGRTPGYGGRSQGLDLVYRAGGSLRMALGAERPAARCVDVGPDACLDPHQGEPVWLAR